MLRRVAVLISAAGMVAALGCSQSDPGITTAVKSKFAADDTVKAYQIDVDTNDHVVTLKGDVESTAAREQAVRLARQTDGVRDVVDRLSVNTRPANAVDDARDDMREAGRDVRDDARDANAAIKDKAEDASDSIKDASHDAARKTGNAAERAGDALSDAAITSAVKTKFLADTRVKGLKIDVDTDHGVVTLTGPVGTKAEGDHAVALARDTKGVTRVVDRLKVR